MEKGRCRTTTSAGMWGRGQGEWAGEPGEYEGRGLGGRGERMGVAGWRGLSSDPALGRVPL